MKLFLRKEKWALDDDLFLSREFNAAPLLEEKLRIDRGTAESVRLALKRVDIKPRRLEKGNEEKLLEFSCLIFTTTGACSPVEKGQWTTDFKLSAAGYDHIFKEPFALAVDSKSFLAKCISKEVFRGLIKLPDQSECDIELLLFDYGENLQERWLEDPLPSEESLDLEIFEDITFDFAKVFPQKAPSILVQAKANFRQELDYLIPELDLFHNNPIDLVLNPILSKAIPRDRYHNSDPLEEKLDENLGIFVIEVPVIEDEEVEIRNIVPFSSFWVIPKFMRLNLHWGVFDKLQNVDLEEPTFEGGTQLLLKPEDVTPNQKPEVNNSIDDQFDNDSSGLVMSNQSIISCRGDSVAEITVASVFPDSIFFGASEHEEEAVEDINHAIQRLPKRRKLSIPASFEGDNFPMNSILEFTDLAVKPQHNLGNEVETEPCEVTSEKIASQEGFVLKEFRCVVMNLSLFSKNRLLFDALQELQRQEMMKVVEWSFVDQKQDFELYISPTLATLTVPFSKINQHNVYTGRRLLVEELMEIAHQSKEIIVIAQLENESQHSALIDSFREELELNKIQLKIVSSQKYLSVLMEIIQSKGTAFEMRTFEENEPEEAFLAECGISNPFLIKEILRRGTLEDFVAMSGEKRVQKFKDIMTIELLELLQNSFETMFC